MRDILDNVVESSNEVKAVHMKDSLSSVRMIDKGDRFTSLQQGERSTQVIKDALQRSFEAMGREIEYISQFPMVREHTWFLLRLFNFFIGEIRCAT